METYITYICQYAHDAHWIIFLLLLLAGLNVPISEDILMMSGGIIASTCVPDHTIRMFIWIYMGCIVAAWETYWIGRLLGPKLYKIKWFNHILPGHRVETLHYYYEKFHFLTFIAGRFIPFGVRNALFLSSGLGKMPFGTFILRDGFAAIISTNVFFYIGYAFGANYQILIDYIKKYEFIGFGLFASAIALIALMVWYKKHQKFDNNGI